MFLNKSLWRMICLQLSLHVDFYKKINQNEGMGVTKCGKMWEKHQKMILSKVIMQIKAKGSTNKTLTKLKMSLTTKWMHTEGQGCWL